MNFFDAIDPYPYADYNKTLRTAATRQVLHQIEQESIVLLENRNVLPLGSDIENNLVFIWPGIAEADLSKLTPQQEVWLYRLVSPAEAKDMIEAKRWKWWRLAIGADGTWHTFHKAE